MLIALSALAVLMFAFSQELAAKKVRFTLDLTGYTANTTGVHVSGDFQEAAGFPGGNWQPGTTAMENEAGTEYYSVVVDIPAGAKYEYKFLNGDQWYDSEFVPVESRVLYDFNDNRWFYLDSLDADTTLIGPIPFSGNAPVGTFLLRFRVDMQLQWAIDPAGVHVAGDFQDWDPSILRMYSFDGFVYEYIAYIDQASPGCKFRYINGNTAGGYELVPGWCSVDGNRFITVTEDTVLNTVCFGYCGDCSTAGLAGSLGPSAVPVIYPNPASANAFLEFNDGIASHDVMIINILGEVMLRLENIDLAKILIPADELGYGVYLVQVSSGGKWISTLKFIVSQQF